MMDFRDILSKNSILGGSCAQVILISSACVPSLPPHEVGRSRITLQQLAAHPEHYEGRHIFVPAFGYRVFEGAEFERLQLWAKDKDGNCSTVGGKSFSISRSSIRGLGPKLELSTNDDNAPLFLVSGVFRNTPVVVNPGIVEFHWDGYLEEVSIRRLDDSCVVR